MGIFNWLLGKQRNDKFGPQRWGGLYRRLQLLIFSLSLSLLDSFLFLSLSLLRLHSRILFSLNPSSPLLFSITLSVSLPAFLRISFVFLSELGSSWGPRYSLSSLLSRLPGKNSTLNSPPHFLSSGYSRRLNTTKAQVPHPRKIDRRVRARRSCVDEEWDVGVRKGKYG